MHNEVVQQRSSARAAVKHHNQECLKLYSGLLEIEVEVKKNSFKGSYRANLLVPSHVYSDKETAKFSPLYVRNYVSKFAQDLDVTELCGNEGLLAILILILQAYCGLPLFFYEGLIISRNVLAK
ncbi:hypothetical protein ACU8KH_02841 [Lachancea thermotolerans]